MRTSSEILESAIAALPKTLNLVCIDYREDLNIEQCASIVGGMKDDVVDEISDNMQDHYYESPIDPMLKYAVPDETERKILFDSEDYDEFRSACWERDESNPYADLLKNTGRKMVRFYIRDSKNERVTLDAYSERWSDERIEKEAKRLAKAARIEFNDGNKNALIEMIENATYGGDLCILGYVEMTDIDKMIEHLLRNEDDGRVRLTFKNPALLIHDNCNGSGHESDVQGEIVIRFGKSDLSIRGGVMSLDHKGAGTGYSWSDDIAGVVYSAYESDPQIYTYKSRKKKHTDSLK